MRKLIALLLLALPMWAATSCKSRANGVFSATTTWANSDNSTPCTTADASGIPGVGDTISNITHTVTVDEARTVGTSPTACTPLCNTSDVITIGSGGSLVFTNGNRLTIEGDLDTSGTLTFQPGGLLRFDGSVNTQTYRLKENTANVISAPCTAALPCTIDFNPAGPAAVITLAYGSANGNWDIAYMNFTVVSVGPPARSSGAHITITDSTFTGLASPALNFSMGATNGWTFDRNQVIGAAYNTTVLTNCMTSPNTGVARSFQGDFIHGGITMSGSGTCPVFDKWIMDGTIIEGSILEGSTILPGTPTSAKNMTFTRQMNDSASFAFDLANIALVDTFLLHSVSAGVHQQGAFRVGAQAMGWTGGVVEDDYNVACDHIWTSPGVWSQSFYVGTQNMYLNNLLVGLNAAGKSAGCPLQMKGTKYTKMTVTHTTAPLAYDTTDYGVNILSSGLDAMAWVGEIPAHKSNLYWYKSPVTGYTNGMKSNDDTGVPAHGPITGTAAGTSTTTVLDDAGKGFLAQSVTGTGGASSIEGDTVLITGGGGVCDVGSTSIISIPNTQTELTVSPAFAHSMAGCTYAVYAVDMVTVSDYNVFNGAFAVGNIYDAYNVSSTTTKKGYDNLRVTTPANLGAHDVNMNLSGWEHLVDTTRTIARFDQDYLGYAASPAWQASGTAYNVGDMVSHAVSGFYGARTINWRCIQAHTSGAAGTATEPGGFFGTDTSNGNWRWYWEFAGMYYMRQAQLQRTGYDPRATQANYMSWMRQGFTPQNPVLWIGLDPTDTTSPGAVDFSGKGRALLAVMQ
jgi:hypothetical protein